jgi:hypothetical protein
LYLLKVDSVQSKTTLCRPCLVLISKSPSFGKAVLNCLNSLLHPGPQLATSAAVKRMCASVQTILDICKQETLVSTLTTCEETLRAILHTLKVYIFNVYKYVVAQKSLLKCCCFDSISIG